MRNLSSHKVFSLISLVAVACGGDPSPPTGSAPSSAPGEEGRELQEGFGRDRIPADHPAWEQLRPGFVPAHHFYGERSWGDVTARVLQQSFTAHRDQARVLAREGAWSEVDEVWRALLERLEDPKHPEGEILPALRAILIQAAARERALMQSLAEGEAPALPEGGELLQLRWGYYRALAGTGSLEEVADRASELLDTLAGPDPRDFESFAERHRLRLELLALGLESSDPMGLMPRWSHWEPDEIRLQCEAIGLAARSADPDPWTPGEQLRRLREERSPPSFSVEGLGELPIGDSYLDVAGEPGPGPVGGLSRLGLEDPEHRERLEGWAEELNRSLNDSERVLKLLEEQAAWLEAQGHGSRYYNLKQLKNEGVRQLARLGATAEARALLRSQRPFWGQDFVCPNREGILLGIEGRLLAQAGQREEALEQLRASAAEADRWLAQIQSAPSGPAGPPGQGGAHGSSPPGSPTGSPLGPPPSGAHPGAPPSRPGGAAAKGPPSPSGAAD